MEIAQIENELIALAASTKDGVFQRGNHPCPDGYVFEKAGVNFSDVQGTLPAELAEATPGKVYDFSATGISLVLHPRNPNVQTVHANFRQISKGSCPEQPLGSEADPT